MADLVASWPYLRPYGAFREGCERLPPEIERQLIGSCTTDAEALYAGRLIDQPISRPSKAIPSLNILQSEPESNEALGTETTKNAATKGLSDDPVFIGIRAEKDKDLGAARAAIGDSESLGECQYPASAAGAGVSATYIGPGLYP
jgi:hypothetical protein